MQSTEQKKEFLKSYKWLKIQLGEIEDEIKMLRLEALPGGLAYDGMPHGSGSNSDLSDYAVKFDKLLTKYRRTADRKVKRMAEIVAAIEAVPSLKEQIVLRARYIGLKKWEDIADMMGYADPRPVYRIHGSALINLKIPEKDSTGKSEYNVDNIKMSE